MFGTIGHVRMKSGHGPQLQELMDEWRTTIRPMIPGEMVQLIGHAAGQPDDVVFIALAQDEATYRNLAALPEQDAWFRRLIEHTEGEPAWEDVEMTVETSA